MKLSSIAVPAALAVLAHAEASSQAELPQYTPFDTSKLSSDSFFEQFDSDDWAQLWKISKAKRDDEFTYNGEWALEESVIFPSYKGEKGLVLKTPAAHHAIHAPLPQAFDNAGKTMVLQYEVKLQEGLKCGGAYIKLLSAEGLPSESDEFNNETPYQVMFGPDKCGTTNKVHFIIKRKNPYTGEYEEKHLSVPPMARTVKTTTLYTLIIEPDQNYQIRINGEVLKAGNLLDEDTFTPSLNPPKMVEDESDIKPEDWDDRLQIPDPDQTEKPEDWDEDAPYMIPDPNAKKPESWDEDAEEYISDPEAEKPEDWDDEEDGEWVAPLVFNPECEEHGCGKWEPDMIPNPEYKGKWSQPYIENPNYKGEWAPRQIENPHYYEDKSPADLEPIGGIGFELWAMENNIMFDNIYLGHSIEEAEFVGNETFKPKYALEQEAVLAISPKAEEADKPEPAEEETDIFDFIQDQVNEFAKDFEQYTREFLEDPVNTLSSRPLEAGIYAAVAVSFAAVVLGLLSFVLGLVTGSPKPAVSVTEKKVEEVVEVEDESGAKTSGATKRETRASKRT